MAKSQCKLVPSGFFHYPYCVAHFLGLLAALAMDGKLMSTSLQLSDYSLLFAYTMLLSVSKTIQNTDGRIDPGSPWLRYTNAEEGL